MSNLIEFEGYFRSEEFVANALGLRKELNKLDSPSTKADFTGLTIEQLMAHTDVILALNEEAKKSDAIEILTGARIHLTDLRDSRNFPVKSKYPEMDDDDALAADLLSEIQYCLETGRTGICAHPCCGDMEGMHMYETNQCRKQPLFPNPQAVISQKFLAR